LDKVEKRLEHKDIDYEGRKWRIKKFDAMTGSYIAYKLMAEALPMGIGAKAGIPVPKSSKIMSKQDFIEFQRDCLSVCYEVLPVGLTPVLDGSGSFAVIGIEHDVKTVMMLTIQALTFNISSFFDESLLASLAGAISSIVPPDAKI
jgi:hypothetical protein